MLQVAVTCLVLTGCASSPPTTHATSAPAVAAPASCKDKITAGEQRVMHPKVFGEPGFQATLAAAIEQCEADRWSAHVLACYDQGNSLTELDDCVSARLSRAEWQRYYRHVNDAANRTLEQ